MWKAKVDKIIHFGITIDVKANEEKGDQQGLAHIHKLNPNAVEWVEDEPKAKKGKKDAAPNPTDGQPGDGDDTIGGADGQ